MYAQHLVASPINTKFLNFQTFIAPNIFKIRYRNLQRLNKQCVKVSGTKKKKKEKGTRAYQWHAFHFFSFFFHWRRFAFSCPEIINQPWR